MSKYTVQLRRIVELDPEVISSGRTNLREKVIVFCSNTPDKWFLNSYPIFDGTHRITLNKKIINHYLFNEIGLETVELWKYRFDEKMQLIMPKYNMMYKALAQDYKIFENLNTVRKFIANEVTTNTQEQTQNTTNDRTREGTYTDTGNNNTTSDYTDNNSVDLVNNTETTLNDLTTTQSTQDLKHADYPQSNIRVGDYLSEENLNTDNGTSDRTGDTTGKTTQTTTTTDTSNNTVKNNNSLNHTENFTDNDTGSNESNIKGNSNKDNNVTENISGLNGYPAEALQKYMEAIYNIDEMIVKDMSDLFFLLYD